MITQRLRIRGRVQGVGFRYAMRDEARRRGIAGWVRNRTDGSVEALLQGPSEKVAELVAWAQAGPSGSRVDEVAVEALPQAPVESTFELRPTV